MAKVVYRDFKYDSRDSALQRLNTGYPNATSGSSVFYDETIDQWIARFEIPKSDYVPKAIQYIRGNKASAKAIMALDTLRVRPVIDGTSGSEIWELDIYVNGLKKPIRLKNGDYVYNDKNVGLVTMTQQGYLAKKRRKELR